MKALITGASSGIGLDMAKYLASKKYELILVARDREKLEKVQESLPTKVTIIVADLSNEQKVKELYVLTAKEDIDILINNAGFGDFGNFTETDINKEMKMIDVNVNALHILTKLFLQDMVKKDKGRILNIASSAGFFAGPVLNTYYATKNYALKWTEGIYEELRRARSNVHISCLCPGPVDTNFNKVAGGSFTVKALTSEFVARYGIDKCLKNKLVIVPGFGVRCGIFFNRFLPIKLSLKIVYNIQKKKVK